MILCIQKSTGKILSANSVAFPGCPIRDAIANGYDPDDLEEREVTPQEYAAMTAPSPADLAKQAACAELVQLDWQSIRALRSFARGKAVKADTDMLDQLDARAAELRGVINA